MTKIEVCNITPRDIKSAHREFYKNDEHVYEWLTHQSRLDVNRQIKAVKNDELQRVVDECPIQAELIAQCAHWVHALAGKHFFPDANHRTSIATLRQMLSDNQIEGRITWKVDAHNSTIKESKRVRKEADVTMDTLYREDRLYDIWYSYFENAIE